MDKHFVQRAPKRVQRPTPQACGVVACAVQGSCGCYRSRAKPLVQHGIVVKNIASGRRTLPLEQTVAAAIEHQVRAGDLAPATLSLYVQNWDLFVKFSTAEGVTTADAVDEHLVELFLNAPSPNGVLPAIGTKRVRRSAVRKLFTCLRAIGAASHDPTSDSRLPGQTDCAARPLSDAEMENCRAFAKRRSGKTRNPALWALVEAGATFPELREIVVGAVDINAAEVLLPGGAGTVERLVPLNDWSVEHLERHFRQLSWDLNAHAVFGGNGPTTRSATMKAELHRIFELSGLAGDPAATTYSVRGWLGRQVWDETNRIEKVALRLGLNSTDRAWAVIDVDWRKLP